MRSKEQGRGVMLPLLSVAMLPISNWHWLLVLATFPHWQHSTFPSGETTGFSLSAPRRGVDRLLPRRMHRPGTRRLQLDPPEYAEFVVDAPLRRPPQLIPGPACRSAIKRGRRRPARVRACAPPEGGGCAPGLRLFAENSLNCRRKSGILSSVGQFDMHNHHSTTFWER